MIFFFQIIRLVSKLKIILANIGRLAYYKQVINNDEDFSNQKISALRSFERGIIQRSEVISLKIKTGKKNINFFKVQKKNDKNK